MDFSFPSRLPDNFHLETPGLRQRDLSALVGTWHLTRPWAANGDRTFDLVISTLLRAYPMDRDLPHSVSQRTYIWSSSLVGLDQRVRWLVRNLRSEVLPAEDEEELLPQEDRVLFHAYSDSLELEAIDREVKSLLPEVSGLRVIERARRSEPRQITEFKHV